MSPTTSSGRESGAPLPKAPETTLRSIENASAARRSSGVGPLTPIPLRPSRLDLRLHLERGVDQRLAFDLALADQPEPEDRAGEGEDRAEQEDLVEAVEEALLSCVRRHVLRLRRQGRDRFAEVARRRRFDQTAGLVVAERPVGRLLGLVSPGAEEDRSPGRDADGDPDLAEGV